MSARGKIAVSRLESDMDILSNFTLKGIGPPKNCNNKFTKKNKKNATKKIDRNILY